MFGNFEALLHEFGSKRHSSQPARLLTLAPWNTAEVHGFVEMATLSAATEDKRALGEFLQALDAGILQDLYGDLPFHPLFLQFILEDVCASGLRARNRPELIERWIREKIRRDMRHHGIPPEHAVDRNERRTFSAENVSGVRNRPLLDTFARMKLDSEAKAVSSLAPGSACHRRRFPSSNRAKNFANWLRASAIRSDRWHLAKLDPLARFPRMASAFQ